MRVLWGFQLLENLRGEFLTEKKKKKYIYMYIYICIWGHLWIDWNWNYGLEWGNMGLGLNMAKNQTYRNCNIQHLGRWEWVSKRDKEEQWDIRYKWSFKEIDKECFKKEYVNNFEWNLVK